MKLARLVGVPVAMLGVLIMTAAPAGATTSEFARMTGPQEIPGPGDADATGAGFFDIYMTGTPRVCVAVRFEGTDTPIAMHIHSGAAGSAGPIVVNLSSFMDGRRGCAAASVELLRDIKRHPANYYCNIHTSAFSGGALRGQLELAQN